MFCSRRDLLAFLGVLLVIAVALSAGESRAARAFKIDPAVDAQNPGSASSIAIHEALIAEAIKAASTSGAALNGRAIGLIQAGAEVTDLIHQWDSEFHFDNIPVGKEAAFTEAFANLQQEMATAQSAAADVSAEGVAFEAPAYTSFRSMYEAVQQSLGDLLDDPNCTASNGCPAARIKAYIPRFAKFQDDLNAAGTRGGKAKTSLYPNPDPRGPTNPKSLFAKGQSNHGLTTAWASEFGLLREVFKAVVPPGAGLSDKPGASDPVVKKLIDARDFFTAYHAYVALGEALHATEDFFAHTNYVELMAGDLAKDYPEGVPVGVRLSTLGITPDQIPVPATFADFTPAGLKKLMGPVRYAKLESGWASTPWLEGPSADKCASIYSDLNPIDPGYIFGQPGQSGNLAIVSGVTIHPGTDPDPPKGFTYCHYHTTTNVGLNKDEPYAPLRYNTTTINGEPSHQNFEYARAAALKMSKLLFQSFWDKYSKCLTHAPMNRTGSAAQSVCRKPVAVWAGQWSTSTGGFALYLMDAADIENAKHEQYAPQLYNKLKCPGTSYYRGGYVDPNDRGKIIVCGTSTHVYGRWRSNEDGNSGSFDISLTSTNPPKFTGWAQSDGGSRDPWTGTWLRH